MTLVDRDVPPRDDALPLGLDGLVQEPLELRGARCFARKEADRDPVRPQRRQRRPDLGAEERVRQLQRHPRAVARTGVRSLGPAVLEVGERRRGPHERLVARDPVEAGDERDAAGVVLVRRVVEADGSHSMLPFAVPLACVVCA